MATPVLLYLNRGGGLYTPGRPNDSAQNVSSVLDQAVQAPAWDVSPEAWDELVGCVGDLFARFNLRVTDADPGDAPHIEAVVGGSPLDLGFEPRVAGVSPFRTDCAVIDRSVVFIFPDVVDEDLTRVCELVAQETAHSLGLDHQYLCRDPMSYLEGCGAKSFQFVDAPCGEYEPRACQCGQTQNSAMRLLDHVGAGQARSLWLLEPPRGAAVSGRGLTVTAGVTHAPVVVELYLDGVLTGAAVPDPESAAPYQLLAFDVDRALLPGTHYVEVRARYTDGERSVSRLFAVEGESEEPAPPDLRGSGCAASSRGGPWAALAILGALGALSRRARGRRRAAAIVCAFLLSAGAGCATAPWDGPDAGISGQGGDCAAAWSEAELPVGLLWSPEVGTCTATLLGPRALITAAHCAEGEPILFVFDGNQHVVSASVRHPLYEAFADPAADLAVLSLYRAVEGAEPLAIEFAAPAEGDEITLISFDRWSPERPETRPAQGIASQVAEVEPWSFWQSSDPGACAAGRAGGPVARDDPEGRRVLGLQTGGPRSVRLDARACWIACRKIGGVSPEQLPPGCDCSGAP